MNTACSLKLCPGDRIYESMIVNTACSLKLCPGESNI